MNDNQIKVETISADYRKAQKNPVTRPNDKVGRDAWDARDAIEDAERKRRIALLAAQHEAGIKLDYDSVRLLPEGAEG